MAGRGSIGVGTGVTIFTLALFSLAGIVCSAIFFAKWKDSEQGLNTAKGDLTDFVTAGERNRDDIRAIVTQAKGKRQSAIAFMTDQYGQMAMRATGVRGMTIEQFEE
jgi:hypothetical protein